MGKGNHIFYGGDPVVGEIGDVFGHPARLQRSNQIILVDQPASGQVQNPDLSLHLGNGIGVDKVFGCAAVGNMEGDIVGYLIEFVYILYHMDVTVQA